MPASQFLKPAEYRADSGPYRSAAYLPSRHVPSNQGPSLAILCQRQSCSLTTEESGGSGCRRGLRAGSEVSKSVRMFTNKSVTAPAVSSVLRCGYRSRHGQFRVGTSVLPYRAV
jgi:hypothetical protein